MALTIMIQGSMSNVGKSLLTAGLCRIFHQDGYKVAPFKSQNMALNSYVTEEGLEMGRAQVMQCEAAGIAPSVNMNPILLKPTSNMGSQVIVCGEVFGNMSAAEYFQYKNKLRPIINEAFYALSAEFDIIVIEGAGSPAEINLKENDIVNMGMAEIADAPVLLVGDIDRGGVFAQLLGTLQLLTAEERKRVKGLIVNKFRGDLEILRPGIAQLEEVCQNTVLGVVPYLDLDLEDEDSLASRMNNQKAPALLDIAVIKLPHISNFTDFNPLEAIVGVCLRYVKSPLEIGTPDLICLPGSKNTMDDLEWLRKTGLEAIIQTHARNNKPIIGICGGFQMMGETLFDPDGIESGGKMQGIGLLPISTVFQQHKTRTQVRGKFSNCQGIFQKLTGTSFSGYEIHMGETRGTCKSLTEIVAFTETAKPDGGQKGNCYGSYIHGIFDEKAVSLALVTALLEAKGISAHALEAFNFKEYKEDQYDRLAEALRHSLDMEQIYKILNKESGDK